MCDIIDVEKWFCIYFIHLTKKGEYIEHTGKCEESGKAERRSDCRD